MATLTVHTELSQCVCHFTVDMYKNVAKSHPMDNVFMSPSSILIVLTMLYVGAKGTTQDQMATVMKFKKMDRNDIVQSMGLFRKMLTNKDRNFTLRTADKLYINKDKERPVLDEYLAIMSEHFQTDIEVLDFANEAESTRQKINQWVEEHTNNKIKDLLPVSSINFQTVMVVVDAIYFKGNWATQFRPENTIKDEFVISEEKRIIVDMMKKRLEKVKFGESSSLACKVLEIPYEGETLGMIVVLPTSTNGLFMLEEKLNLEELQNLVHQLQPASVDVTLPKFKLEFTLDLKQVLSSLGMTLLFDPKSADLSGIGQQLYVSDMYHKAFVDVNEEGTEAAAATAAITRLKRSTLETTHSFVANHSFLFMIWDHRVNVPLFIGRLVEPLPTGSASLQANEEL